MLEVWIDGKKVEAKDVQISYTHKKSGDRVEIKLLSEDDDAWLSLKQLDSLGHITSELESWADQGRMKRSSVFSVRSCPPNSTKNATKEIVQSWFEESARDSETHLIWSHNVSGGYDCPFTAGDESGYSLAEVQEIMESKGFRVIYVFDLKKDFEEQYHEAVEE